MASIRWVRPGLHQPGELLGLALEAGGEHVEGGQQVVGDGERRGDVDRGREGVVAGLAGVDVVVGVHVGPAARRRGWRSPRWRSCWSWCPTRSGRRRSGTRRRARPRRPPSAAVDDRRRLVGVEDAELAVDLRRRRLDPADRVDQRRLDRGAADREVLDRALGLRPPEGVGRAPGPRPCSRARCGTRCRLRSCAGRYPRDVEPVLLVPVLEPHVVAGSRGRRRRPCSIVSASSGAAAADQIASTPPGRSAARGRLEERRAGRAQRWRRGPGSPGRCRRRAAPGRRTRAAPRRARPRCRRPRRAPARRRAGPGRGGRCRRASSRPAPARSRPRRTFSTRVSAQHLVHGESEPEPADHHRARLRDLGQGGLGERLLGARLERVHHEDAVGAQLQRRRPVLGPALAQHQLSALRLGPRDLDVLHAVDPRRSAQSSAAGSEQ